ncbi:ABC transporter ATP-binding protein [Bradyrhizobium prioriisuperbiae]|uniref:ABC transporter ATP-binding protein n=1 Tax=Bradyrhizobium prioriisuperbiae TaxID=2854389 RepID=UPI0028E98D0A|nr:ABC transporter ATP-binding protein [Bradyrhizobium prioritasuperba]
MSKVQVGAVPEVAAPVMAVDDLSYVVNGPSGELLILKNVSLAVRKREFVSIVGASGCGKTTLLRLMAGLLRPTEGQVTFNGATVTEPHQQLAVVFQDYGRALLPWRTVADNVSLALEARRVPGAERPAIISGLLQKVGLGDRHDAFPLQLSGGMQQRLQIARCLAQQPEVLLMDEPFGALDAMTRQNLQDEVARLSAESGTTVIFVTHDLEEAIYLGDRVISMESRPGRISEVVEIDLPRPRHQLRTREDARFLAYRHRLFDLLPTTGH